MTTDYVYCILLVALFSCKSQPQESPAKREVKADSVKAEASYVFKTDLKTDEDSIRSAYGISGRITLINKFYIDGDAQYAFIAYNSEPFSGGFSVLFGHFDESEQKQYDDLYRSLKTRYQDSLLAPLSKYQDMIGKWLPVYSHEKRLCVYRPCGFPQRHQLTDSTYIQYYMDGAYPHLIRSVEKAGNEVILNTTGPTLHFKLVDAEKSLYLFTDGNYENYLIPLEKSIAFPAVVEECTEDGVDLVGFDPVHYQ